jgi:hypothetical protein
MISPVLSQDSLLNSFQNKKNIILGEPLIVIKGEEISRFPSNNFLDAVNGLYPWLFQQTTPTNYTYVVNGHILQDINAISLYDIEEVSFSRGNMDGTLYPFSQAGVFYIKTKTANSRKPVIRFHSQYNTVWNKERSIYGDGFDITKDDRKNGYLHSSHISVALGDEKLQFYASLMGTGTKDPGISQNALISLSSVEGSYNSKQTNLGTYMRLTYQLSRTLSTGISANYFSGVAKNNFRYKVDYGPSGSISDQSGNSRNPISYYHVSPHIRWAPNKRLRNTISFEYSDDHFKSKDVIYSIYTSPGGNINDEQYFELTAYLKGYLLRNNFECDLTNGKLKTGVGAVFSYLNRQARSEYEQLIISNGITNIATGFSYARQKVTTLNPNFHFSYNDVFSGYAGHSFLLNKQEGILLTSDSKHGSYAGTTLNIKNLLKQQAGLQRLDISFHYGDMTRNAFTNYWLPEMTAPIFNPPSVFYSFTVLSGSNIAQKLYRSKMLSLQLNSAFLDGRLMAGAEWSSLKEDNLYTLIVPQPTAYFYTEGKRTIKGVSIYTAGKLISKADQQWDIRFNALFPNYKHKVTYYTNPINLIEAKYAMQAGLQNYFRFGGLYAQANVLAGFDRKIYNYSLPEPKTPGSSTDVILNYIMVGYDLPVASKSTFKKVGIFLHARNLLGTSKAKEYYIYDSYAGLGIQLQMN